MDPFSLVCLAGVCGLMLFDQRAALRDKRPRPRPRRGPQACRCPYCHQELEDGTPLQRCARCATRHHQGCFDAHGGCSVFGCARPGVRAARPLVARAGEVVPQAPDPAPAAVQPEPGPVAA